MYKSIFEKDAWVAKDASTESDKALDQAKNKDIVANVMAEVAKIDGSVVETKKNIDTIQRDFVMLKELVDQNSNDVVAKERLDKFAEALSNRQAEMDAIKAKSAEIEKAMQKRIDDLEAAISRPQGGVITNEEAAEIQKAADEFQYAIKSMRGGAYLSEGGVQGNIDAYNAFAKSFNSYLRSKSDKPEMTMAPAMVKDLSVGSDPDGGYTVIPQMSNQIFRRVFELDPIRSLCGTDTISTKSIKYLVDFDQAGYGWEGETVAGSKTSTPQLNSKEISVHTLYAKPYASMDVIDDASINIEQWLADHVARRFARGEGAAFVSADGVGKPRGFLTYDNVTTAGTPEYGKVEQINMTSASALTYNGFVRVKYALVEEYMNRATWVMNRSSVAAALQIKDDNEQPIWQPSMVAGAPSMLLGLPVAMSASMPAVASDALSVCLADWSEFYRIVDRMGISILRDMYTQKPFVEFYTRKRVGGDVLNFAAGVIGKVAA